MCLGKIQGNSHGQNVKTISLGVKKPTHLKKGENQSRLNG
jgi:hypothetical protein